VARTPAPTLWRSPSAEPDLHAVRVAWRAPVPGGALERGAAELLVSATVEGFAFMSARTSAAATNG
jgi:hypothetical protein